MRFRRHPSRRELLDWLEGKPGTEALDEHILECEVCAARLIDLESVSEQPGLQAALVAALAPPSDLTDRLEEGVKTRLASRAVFGVLADLYVTGWETSKMLLIEGDQ